MILLILIEASGRSRNMNGKPEVVRLNYTGELVLKYSHYVEELDYISLNGQMSKILPEEYDPGLDRELL
jgi:hypothetical protein